MLILIFSGNTFGTSFSDQEILAYRNRNFVLLKHLLIFDHKDQFLAEFRGQERDLAGCREIHHGNGGLSAVLECMAFLNREKKLGLAHEGAQALVRDINILCRQLADQPQSLKKLLNHRYWGRGERDWGPCIEESWRQVYLTAYANFDADPVSVMALVRRAQEVLPPETSWASKVRALLRKQ